MGLKKKVYLFTSLFLLITLAACTSTEAEELVNYHNNYLKNVNQKASAIAPLMKKSLTAGSLKEAYEIQKAEVQPIIEEITTYMEKQSPKTDAVKELHAMRVE